MQLAQYAKTHMVSFITKTDYRALKRVEIALIKNR